jgi:hypothetical protein
LSPSFDMDEDVLIQKQVSFIFNSSFLQDPRPFFFYG